MKVYSARLVEGSKSSYNVEFRHPVLRDNNGKQGRKIRRGLGTDKEYAETIVKAINELLKDNTLWNLSEKQYVKDRYGEKVAEIFYDKIIEQTGEESEAIRESIIEIPKDEEYSVAMFIGGTGVGKTSDIKVILGLDNNQNSFPAVSPTRTTTCSSEYIFSHNDSDESECVVTFLNKNQIINLVQESIDNGIKRLVLEEDSKLDLKSLKKKIANDFMSHQENRFRLNYILGQYFETDEKLEKRIEAYKKQNLDIDFIDLRLNNKKINIIIDNIIKIYEQIKMSITKSEDEEVEKVEQIAKCEENQIIIDIIFEHIMETINLISERYKQVGEFKMVRDWPIYWYGKSAELSVLLDTLEYIGGNGSRFFGRLLTPLVDGIRLKAPFKTNYGDGHSIPKLVIIDSEGAGHSGKKITSLPLSITNKFNSVDAVIIVDKADEAMKGISQVILNEVSSRGSQEKLIMLYNRFENIEGENLFDYDEKKDFILDIQNNAIKQMKEDFQFSEEIINLLIKRLEKNTFFLSKVNEFQKNEETSQQIETLIEKIILLSENKKRKIKDIPKYEMDKIILANIKAKEIFNNQWDSYLGIKNSSSFSKQHWTRIKALSNRLANWPGYLGYDNLTPASDMSSYIMTQIREFLHNPRDWKYDNNITIEDRIKVINLIQQKVSIQINELIQQRIKVDQYKQWVNTFSHRGEGSTVKRKDDIKRIFDDVMPNVTLSYSIKSEEFIGMIKDIIKNSIKELDEKYSDI